MTTATIEAPPVSQARATEPPPTDAILSLDQVAPLLGKTLKGVRHLTKVGLLKHQLIDGKRCIWLSDLITYKADFDKRFAEWESAPLNRMWDDPFFHETFGMTEIPETR